MPTKLSAELKKSLEEATYAIYNLSNSSEAADFVEIPEGQPPVLGWTAVTGTVDPHALLLFLIIFVWTPPHFWALAIHRRDEYAKVDIPMLPVTHGVDFTRLQVLLYTILLVVVTVMPFATGMSGLLYLAGALGLGGVFLYHAWALMRDVSGNQAMKTFGYSIVYLMALFAFLLVDHYLPNLMARLS